MRIVVICSGGMDSVTMLHQLAKEGNSVRVLSFNYGQRHKKELEYAKKACDKLHIVHNIVDISNLNELMQGSSLTSEYIDTPHGHYKADNMKMTVVPNRNATMLDIATAYAISIGYDAVAIAAHAGDHHIYPDCRPEFLEKYQEMVCAGNYAQILIFTPYLHLTKGEIAKRGLKMRIKYDEETWTCYEGKKEPCGLCGACVERKEALEYAIEAGGGLCNR